MKISMVESATATDPKGTDLSSVLAAIKSGRWAEPVAAIRRAISEGDTDRAGELKKKLPGILFSGTFSKRRADALQQHSGLVCLDLDHVEGLPEVRARIDTDRHTLASFISPSGNGLKILVRVDPTPADGAEHKTAFEACRALYEGHGITVDPSGKDVSRLCFVSHDPDLFRRDHSEPITWEASAPERPDTPPATSRPPTAHRAAYVQAAIDGELSNVRTSPQGTRNATLNAAAFSVGQFVGAGAITRADAENELMAAAAAAGLPDHEARITIKSGLDAGERDPREIPEPIHRTDPANRESRLTNPKNEAPEPWGEPIPFSVMEELPAYPVDCLPDFARAYVQDLSETLQVPPDLPAQLLLGAFSTAAAKKWRVQIGRAFSEPLNIYCLTALPPGSRKSPTFSTVFRPLEEFQARQSGAAAASIARASERRKIEEARLSELRKLAAKTNDLSKRAILCSEAETLAANLTEIPTPPRVLAMDASPEKLASLLCQNEGRIALYDSEGGAIFDVINGRYASAGAGPNVEFYLRAHAGDALTIDRIGRGTESTDSAALTLCLTCQPSVLRDLGDKKALRGRGLLARFLYSIPATSAGGRMFSDRPQNQELADEYERRITELLSTGTGERFLHISGDALEVWRAGADSIERDQAPGGPLEGLTDFASKLAGAVARIAGLLHLMAGLTERDGISAGTVQNAWIIGGYYLEHAKAVFSMLTAGTRSELAQKILHWITTGRRESFTLSDVFRNYRNSAEILEAEDLRPGLECLAERNFIRELDPPTGRGRKPAARFEVNPAMWGRK